MTGANAVGAKPFLFWGTLLGHRREGAFLRHDNDIDLCILPTDVPRIDAWIRETGEAGIACQFISPYEFRLFFKSFRLLWVDVWIMHPDGDDYITCLHDYRNRQGVFVYRFPQTWLQHLDSASLENCDLWEPREAERLLASLYGDWRVPRKDHYDDQAPAARLMPHPPATDLLAKDLGYPRDWAG